MRWNRVCIIQLASKLMHEPSAQKINNKFVKDCRDIEIIALFCVRLLCALCLFTFVIAFVARKNIKFSTCEPVRSARCIFIILKDSPNLFYVWLIAPYIQR